MSAPQLKVEDAVQKVFAGDPDGWEHLMAVCWRAVGKLYAPCTTPWVPKAKKAATAQFIEEFLSAELKPYLKMNVEERQTALAMGAFRYLPRRCRLRLIDAIRRDASRRRRGLLADRPWLSIDAPMRSGKAFSELDMTSATLPPQLSNDELRQYFIDDEERLVAENGQAWYDAMLILVSECYPDVQRGDLIRSLARALGVSERQARNRLPYIMARVLAALAAYKSATRALHRWLSAAVFDERDVPRTGSKPDQATQEGEGRAINEWAAAFAKAVRKNTSDPTRSLTNKV